MLTVLSSKKNSIEMEIKRRTKFDAEQFVESLLSEGAEVFCDENVQSINETTLPKFYNAKLYKRGQLFYEKHKFALNFGMLMGIVAGLAVPFFLNILSLTRGSSTPSAAAKRYKKTITHVITWYQSDLTPDSQLWKSIISVRRRHISANDQLRKAKKHVISQREMGLTLCGFMGYPLMKRQKLGLYNVSDEDWKAFIHFWKVIGFLMGVEDRFNICRDSVEETTKICNLIEKRVVAPYVSELSENSVFMITNLVNGFIKPLAPLLTTSILLKFFYNLSGKNENEKIFNSEIWQKIWDNLILLLMSLGFASLRFTFSRIFHNYLFSRSIKNF